MTQQQQALIMEITQSVIAVLVIIGGGIAMLTGNPHISDLAPILAVVVGYYFGRQVQQVTTAAQVVSVAAAGAANSKTTAEMAAVNAVNAATVAKEAADSTKAV